MYDGPAAVSISRWNNTVLVRSNDTTIFSRLAILDCVKKSEMVWESPDSIDRFIKTTDVAGTASGIQDHDQAAQLAEYCRRTGLVRSAGRNI